MQILTLTLVLLSAFTFRLVSSTVTLKREAEKALAPASGQRPVAPAALVAPVQAAAVNISSFKFDPKVLQIKVGTTVTWTNTGGTHTAVADGENFSSPTLSTGQTFSHKFTKRGKYPYYCSFHGSKGGGDMAGTIIVVP